MQRAPVDRNLAAANPEKSAEINHHAPHLPGAVHEDIYDTAHVLVRTAADAFSDNSFDLLIVDHRGRSSLPGGGRRRLRRGFCGLFRLG